MERVGIRELRQNLSVYLRRVEAGEALEVTDRGQPVALLAPLSGAGSTAVARLAAQGRIARTARRPLSTLPPAAAEPGRPLLSKLLDEDRSERL